MNVSSITFLPRLGFLFPISWKNPCGFYSPNEHDLRVLDEMGVRVEGRVGSQPHVYARVLSVCSAFSVAIAEMVFLWGGHKAELEQPRGR